MTGAAGGHHRHSRESGNPKPADTNDRAADALNRHSRESGNLHPAADSDRAANAPNRHSPETRNPDPADANHPAAGGPHHHSPETGNPDPAGGNDLADASPHRHSRESGNLHPADANDRAAGAPHRHSRENKNPDPAAANDPAAAAPHRHSRQSGHPDPADANDPADGGPHRHSRKNGNPNPADANDAAGLTYRHSRESGNPDPADANHRAVAAPHRHSLEYRNPAPADANDRAAGAPDRHSHESGNPNPADANDPADGGPHRHSRKNGNPNPADANDRAAGGPHRHSRQKGNPNPAADSDRAAGAPDRHSRESRNPNPAADAPNRHSLETGNPNPANTNHPADASPHRHSPETGNPDPPDANHPADANHPTRVLLVSALPPPPGGIASWTQTLLDRGLPPPFALEVIDTRVYRQSQFTPSRPTPPEIWRNLRILWRIRRALASGRFSVMHLNCGLTLSGVPRNLASATIAQRAGVPYVAHLHGTFHVPDGGGPGARFYRRAWRRIFAGAARIIALGQPSYRAIMELGDFSHKTVALLPNFVDAQAIPQRAAETGRDSLKIVYTGALIPDKGIYTILELARRLPDARFRLIGGSSDAASHARLLRRIAELGLERRVQILGPIPNREVIMGLAESDVFLFPSQLKFEGFPVSVAEAMAAGLPVVASPVGALPEMVDVPQGGGLIPPDNVAAYVKILANLRDQPALRASMGRHNRQKARREYDYDVVIRRLCGIWAAAAGIPLPDAGPAPGGPERGTGG